MSSLHHKIVLICVNSAENPKVFIFKKRRLAEFVQNPIEQTNVREKFVGEFHFFEVNLTHYGITMKPNLAAASASLLSQQTKMQLFGFSKHQTSAEASCNASSVRVPEILRQFSCRQTHQTLFDETFHFIHLL